MANVFEPEFDQEIDRPPFKWRRSRIGRQTGAQRLGASLYDVPPGAAMFPLHVHHANEELLVVLEGTLHMRTLEGERELPAGEVVACLPGKGGAHRVENRSDGPARVLVLSTMVGPDLNEYPDTGRVWARSSAPGLDPGPDTVQVVGPPSQSVNPFEGRELMAIRTDHVDSYLEGIRPQRSEVMLEMEKLADRDGIPIVSWETGRLLATLVRALQPSAVIEFGTAIGYSTIHMAEQLENGRIWTLERDPTRIEQATGFFDRAGVADRIEIVAGDALESINNLDGPFDFIFIDATKDEYRKYLELAEPKLTPTATLVVDNLLMSGEVAGGDPGHWRPEALEAARAFNNELLKSKNWLGSVLPVGDGVGVAARI